MPLLYEDEEDSWGVIDSVECPRCDSTNVVSIEETLHGVIYMCRDCDNEWEEYG